MFETDPARQPPTENCGYFGGYGGIPVLGPTSGKVATANLFLFFLVFGFLGSFISPFSVVAGFPQIFAGIFSYAADLFHYLLSLASWVSYIFEER